jgi:regulator of nonsense transcripts 1
MKLARPRAIQGSEIEFLSQCGSCQKENEHTVFLLGMSVNGVECQACARDANRDWVPLVKNHAIIQTVLPVPSEGAARGRTRPFQDINSILDQDVRQRSGIVDPRWPDEHKSLLLRYESTHEYYGIVYPMMELEGAHSRDSMHSLSGEITVIEETSYRIKFSMPSARGGQGRLRIDDPLQFSLPALPGTEATGSDASDVSNDTDNELGQDRESRRTVIGQVKEIKIDVEPPEILARIVNETSIPGMAPPDVDNTSGKSTAFVQVNWNLTAHQRKKGALMSFDLDKSCMHSSIKRHILGTIARDNTDNLFHEPYTGADPLVLSELATLRPPTLNESQAEAVEWAMTQRVSIIQGPPGTGKTRTLTALVCRLLNLEQQEQILVCAPSNAAVDHLHRSFLEAKIPAVKVHKIPVFAQGRVSTSSVLASARVVCATCIGSASPLLDKIQNFPIVLVDEATQATEAECLIPLVQGCQKLVLVGDHKQLGPVVVDGKAKAADLAYSMFERLVNLRSPTKVLRYQYRMHPSIWKAPGEVFYSQLVESMPSPENEFREDVNFPWPRAQHPVMLLDTIGKEERSGQSWTNYREARRIVKCIAMLTSSNVTLNQIGVISFYSGQISQIRKLLRKEGMPERFLNHQVSTVDSFQGQERDFIVISCVRGDSDGGIGFLSVKNRVNVAVTRARCGLIVVGNASSLERHAPWDELIRCWRDHGYICDHLSPQ